MKLNDERLNIPYIKLKFKIVFPKESILPKEKVSALRAEWVRCCCGRTALECETARTAGLRKPVS